MTVPLFDTHVVVDWSARSSPSPLRPAKDAIWYAVVRSGQAGPPVYCRTRAGAVRRLTDLLAAELAADRRVLVGFDFPFGYPAGVAARVCGSDRALDLWDWFADAVVDGADNGSNRFEVASRINRLYSGTGPFWGRPDTWDYPDIPVRASARSGADHPPERRHADRLASGAKTVWQLAYSGSVGSQVIVGLPALAKLRRAPELAGTVAVWPFETGLAVPEAQVVLAEIYPSLLQQQAHAARGAGEVLDSAQVRVSAKAFARLDAAGGLGPLFSAAADLSAEDRALVAREEAWILGLGHEDALRAAVSERPAPGKPRRHHYERDPAAIYAQSFATVRREARLDRFGPGLDQLVTRVVHACGMVEVADRIAFSAGALRAGQTALAAGATILCDCRMVAAGIMGHRLPAGNDVVVTLNDPSVPGLSRTLGTTRSAAAVELWKDRLDGAVVAIGNAPTALFHLLDRLAEGWPKPAVVLGFPVGFVGAAESKAALANDPCGCDFVTLRGRRGGSAMASAAVNALAAGLPEERT